MVAARRNQESALRVSRPAAHFAPERIARAKAWCTWLVEYGTEGYAPDVRTRLKILNVVAYLIAVFTLVYAVQQLLADARLLAPGDRPQPAASCCVALLVPFAHRFNDIAGALMIAAHRIRGAVRVHGAVRDVVRHSSAVLRRAAPPSS